MKYQEKDRKSFRENTKDMTFAQKLDYIWDYYKVWILSVAFLIFMGVSMGSSMIANHRALQLVQLGVLNEAEEQAKALWAEEVTTIAVPYFSAEVPVHIMLGARIAANELDVSLLPDDHVNWIHNQEAALPLDEILTLPEDAETLVDEETGMIYGICVNDTPFYQAAVASSDYVADLYLCVSAQEERLPAAVAMAQKIVDTIGTAGE